MSGVFLQCRRTLVILRQHATVRNEMGIFSKLLDKCKYFQKEDTTEVLEKDESKRS